MIGISVLQRLKRRGSSFLLTSVRAALAAESSRADASDHGASGGSTAYPAATDATHARARGHKGARPIRVRRGAQLTVAIGAAAAVGAAIALPAPAAAAEAASNLTVHLLALPTSFSPIADGKECIEHEPNGESDICDGYEVTAADSGSLPEQGPITLTDTLPAGAQVVAVQFNWVQNRIGLGQAYSEPPEGHPLYPELEGQQTTLCQVTASPPQRVSCEFPSEIEGSPVELQPDQRLRMFIRTTLTEGAVAGEPDTATVLQAGADVASTTQGDVFGSSSPAFGSSGLLADATEADGAPDTQAGDHPYEFTTRIDLNSRIAAAPEGPVQVTDAGQPRDVVVDLPLGLLGGALATPRCTFAQLQVSTYTCPLDTLVGHIETEPSTSSVPVNQAIYNMVPERGVAAEFGFKDALSDPHVIVASVAPTPSGYVLRAAAREVPQVALTSIVTTFFGDPAAKQQEIAAREGTSASPIAPAAMFTNSSDCSGQPHPSTLFLDSWENPGSFVSSASPAGEPEVDGANWVSAESSTAEAPPVTGCDKLHFAPSGFSFQPETATADTPTGATFDLKVPQSETPGTLATPPLRDASVTLPPGLTLDPSSAGGLQACSETQIGWLGANGPGGEALANKGLTNFTAKAPECPEASRIGSVEVTSPLIEGTLQGSVFLATQGENPYGARFAGYVVIDDERTGTVVKIPGEIKTNEETGQVTGVFDENPQFPFSELKIHFFGGEQGDLATPEACGTYTTNTDFEPWSAPESGPDATPSSSFAINAGCVSAFTPLFQAGTTSPQAGSFAPFTLSFGREDDEQALGGLSVTLPEGLSGKITGVAECSEAQIAEAAASGGHAQQVSPSCPSSSELGTVTTLSGPGRLPYSVSGKAYLTGPYKGAPYGVAVVVPAVAGPFDLGTVVIRQALYINPTTAQVTDVSDPFPTIRDGIPLRIKHVNVTLSRPDFTLNPTSCAAKTITGTATSTTGAQAALSAHYQAAGCASLGFKPEFSATTQANGTTKGHGASLDVKIKYPEPYTSYANILKVDTSLPLALSSRLTTLQKACTETQFATDPANCPPAADVGTATALSPLLPELLRGPVYLVSHGGRAFPDLDVILQGDNVTIDLTGNTDIKNGITYSKFETVPDAPVSSFELNLPEKENSILAAEKNLCDTNLEMPTEMTGQNGAFFKQSNRITVTGCSGSLSVVSSSVNKKTLKLSIYAPAAGKVTTTGKGVSNGIKTYSGQEALTFNIKQSKSGKLKTKIKLTFTPSTGKDRRKQAKSLTVKFKK